VAGGPPVCRRDGKSPANTALQRTGLRPATERDIVGQTGGMTMFGVAGWIMLLCTTLTEAKTAGGASAGDRRPVQPSSGLSPSIEAIDAACDGLRPMTMSKKRRRLFALFSKDEHDKGHWIEFKRESDLNAAVKEEHVFDLAQVWSREDGATAISMRLSSGSGDWFHFVEYCFRTDGTLARVHSTLNTFNAVDKDPDKDVSGATRERHRYFDTNGKQIEVTRRVRDLKTQRPAPTLQIQDDQEPIYKTATALPFYDLLRGHGAAQPGVAPDGASPRR
jgi:hypothetical protein